MSQTDARVMRMTQLRWWIAVLATISSAQAGDPTGACCYCDGCEVVIEADCGAMGGAYQGDGAECPSFCSDEIDMPDATLREVVGWALGECE